ncbi:hypothetical protein [Thermococcus sp.]
MKLITLKKLLLILASLEFILGTAYIISAYFSTAPYGFEDFSESGGSIGTILIILALITATAVIKNWLGFSYSLLLSLSIFFSDDRVYWIVHRGFLYSSEYLIRDALFGMIFVVSLLSLICIFIEGLKNLK